MEKRLERIIKENNIKIGALYKCSTIADYIYKIEGVYDTKESDKWDKELKVWVRRILPPGNVPYSLGWIYFKDLEEL